MPNTFNGAYTRSNLFRQFVLDRPWVGVRVCHFFLLFVNSFQFQRTKTFQAIFEKVHLAGVQ